MALGGRNTVFSDDIVNREVKRPDLAGSSVNTYKVQNDSLTGSDVDGLTGADINDNSLTGADVTGINGVDVTDNTLGSEDVRQEGLRGEDIDENTLNFCQTGGMVKVGSVCIDRYEVSVWSSPTGGTQYGVSSDNYPCNDNGQDCKGKIFARSVAGVKPSAFITWFQAQQALANSGKRLPTSAEWQMAVAGTPDPGPDNDTTDCNSTFDAGQDPVNTGSRSACVSAHGANDMVANLDEWVADWVPASTTCPNWGTFSNDRMGLSGASTTTQGPGALIRGGSSGITTAAGPFAVDGFNRPLNSVDWIGFRGAR